MGWTGTARRAAAEEYGRQNWRRFAARRQLAVTLAILAVGVAVGVRALARVWQPEWTANLTSWLTLAGITLVLVLVLRFAVSRRRPYRMPRRRFRRGY